MKVLCLTNIPTPYRLDLFATKQLLFEQLGLQYQVWFMAESEPTRNWSFVAEDYQFPYKIWPGIHPQSGLTSFHFNPKLLLQLLKERPSILIIGGAWVFPTSIAALLLAKCFLRHTKVYFWSETYREQHRKENRFKRAIKSFLFSCYDGFLVPGKRAKQYIEGYLKRPLKQQAIPLPNTVNRKHYEGQVRYFREHVKPDIRAAYGIDMEEHLLLLPARLIPVKGIIPFIEALQQIDPASFKNEFQILIAGEGELEQQIKELLSPSYHKRVRLLGYVEEQELLQLYAAADIFLLPSLYDANPLAVVEALWAELPLLLCQGVGNAPEALSVGKNGWLFDVKDPKSVQEALITAVNCSKDEIQEYGRYSHYIALKHFQKQKIVMKMLERLYPDLNRGEEEKHVKAYHRY